MSPTRRTERRVDEHGHGAECTPGGRGTRTTGRVTRGAASV
jgi:hypothetical protein